VALSTKVRPEQPEQRGSGPSSSQFRPDIQALRAIAVGSVVLFHLWPNRLTGGYVGVDVFFAISGFLVTSHLLGEIGRTGTLRPLRFWARRLKRLQPAALLTLLAVCAGVVVWVPRTLWHQFLTEIIGSTLDVENWVLAHNSVDYLASANPPSPVQHFWTLSAEEQFYLGLPLLLLAAVGVSRLRGVGPRRAIAVTLALVIGGSLAYSVWLTRTTPTVAYFSSFTRAWEFACGSLLAMVTARANRPARLVAPWLGVAAIAAACLFFSSTTPFPGYAAALPVLGAAVCIWAGEGSVLEWAGRIPPVALVGRVSYAIYLWHWPLVVLVPYATGRPPDRIDKVLILATSTVLAWASTRFVEEPVRFSPRLLGGRRRPRAVLAWSGLAMGLVLAAALVPMKAEQHQEVVQTAARKNIVASNPRCLGAQALDPKLAPCVNHDLDGVLVPTPATARQDDDNLAACWGAGPGGAKVCHLGPTTGVTKRLYAIGDSHNNALIGSYRRIAEQRNWGIDLSGNAGCYLTAAHQSAVSEGARRGCEAWRESVLRHAAEGGYDAIVVTHSSGDNLVIPQPGQSVAEATVAGLVTAWLRLPDVPVIAIRDNPGMPKGTMDCVSSSGSDPQTRCAPERARALAFDGQQQAARQVRRARYIDLTDFYCTPTLCPPVIGHVLVYRDGRHVTATYAMTVSPYLERAMVTALTR
jgi:peptidoglycan/LPS O-acetylase OafA/YrhL